MRKTYENMHIAIIVHRLDKPRGSEKSQLVLGEKLKDRGHSVSLLSESGEGKGNHHALEITKSDFNDLFFRLQIVKYGWPVLRDLSPDMILAQNHNTLLAACYARRHRIPYVAFYHWADVLSNPFSLSPFIRESAENFAVLLFQPLLRFGYREADISIVPSEFARKQWGNLLPGDVEVVYPFIPNVAEEARSGGDYVLHVTPTPEKGINTTLKIANMMPEEQFVVIGRDTDSSIKEKMDALPNVDYRGYVHDMKPVYKNAWAILVPSTGDEAFGMVAAEAGLYKTPALVSGRGGLSEAVADRFVVNSVDPEPYVDMLSTLNDEYEEHCVTALEYSRSKTAERQFHLFREIVENRTDVRL